MDINRRIAVDGSLSNLKKHLHLYGYEIDDLNADNLGDVSAVITNGDDHDLMEKREIATPIINGQGHSAEEIKNMIENGVSGLI
ncbi:hypothetical protein U472_07825 [Orenia metallireducens]|jgi:hypothetical protein|uniref:YkuS family protein n=1 Tax=Orenia metallireducens TaxID=1413210 RepID=A0A1C0AAT3_9FIRM|nr:YkuS family protein [Orenia metallireducens]OCL27359.1 hypothetical protein U472_07825 [Orenia metallireducens]